MADESVNQLLRQLNLQPLKTICIKPLRIFVAVNKPSDSCKKPGRLSVKSVPGTVSARMEANLTLRWKKFVANCKSARVVLKRCDKVKRPRKATSTAPAVCSTQNATSTSTVTKNYKTSLVSTIGNGHFKQAKSVKNGVMGNSRNHVAVPNLANGSNLVTSVSASQPLKGHKKTLALGHELKSVMSRELRSSPILGNRLKTGIVELKKKTGKSQVTQHQQHSDGPYRQELSNKRIDSPNHDDQCWHIKRLRADTSHNHVHRNRNRQETEETNLDPRFKTWTTLSASAKSTSETKRQEQEPILDLDPTKSAAAPALSNQIEQTSVYIFNDSREDTTTIDDSSSVISDVTSQVNEKSDSSEPELVYAGEAQPPNTSTSDISASEELGQATITTEEKSSFVTQMAHAVSTPEIVVPIKPTENAIVIVTSAEDANNNEINKSDVKVADEVDKIEQFVTLEEILEEDDDIDEIDDPDLYGNLMGMDPERFQCLAALYRKKYPKALDDSEYECLQLNLEYSPSVLVPVPIHVPNSLYKLYELNGMQMPLMSDDSAHTDESEEGELDILDFPAFP